MNRRTLLGAVGSASLVGLAGCQETVEELLEDGDLPEPDEVLGDGELGLEETAAKPGNTIEISGPVEELGEEPIGWLYDATVDEPDEDDRHFVFVDVEESHLVVPVHPADYMGGGPAEIEIRDEDDEIVVSGIEFEVEPLDPAPGTMSGMVDDLETALVEAAETLGYSADELRAANIDDLEPLISGVAVGLQALEGGDVGSVRSLLDGDDEIFGDDQHDEDGLEVVDALAHETGFADDVVAAAQAFAELDEPPSEVDENPGMVGSATGFTSSGSDTLGAPQRGGVERAGTDVATPASAGVFDPEVVAGLHYLMNVQSQFAEVNSGAAAAARDAGGIIIAGTAFIPGGQAVAAGGSVALTVTQLAIDFCEQQLPSRLEIELSADPEVYREDEDHLGHLSGTAEGYSEGFTFTWPDALGAIPGPGMISDVIRRAPSGSSQGIDLDLVDFLHETLTTMWGQFEEEGVLELDPRLYGPVDIHPARDVDYLEAKEEVLDWETDNEPFDFDEGMWSYEPLAVGRSLLTVHSREGKFGNADATDQIEIEVESIEVIIREASMDTSGNIYYLDPEEDTLIEFYAEVEGATDEEVDWEFERISGPAVPWPDPWGPDNNQIAFDISGIDFPEDDRGEYVIEAESATRDGLRADGEPPRTDRVTVLVTDEEEEEADLVVEPNPGCLELDDSHQLTARSDGQEIGFDELTWRIEGEGDGDITPDGVFVPSVEGEVEIEFWLEDDRDVTSEMHFRVSEECTELRIRVDGHEEVYNCVGVPPISSDSADASMSVIETRGMRWDRPPGDWAGDPIKVRLLFQAAINDQSEGETMEYSGYLILDNADDDSTGGNVQWHDVPISVTRRVETEAAHDGSDLDVFDGEFGPSDAFDHGDTTVEGEFHGVAWAEDGCGEVYVGR